MITCRLLGSINTGSNTRWWFLQAICCWLVLLSGCVFPVANAAQSASTPQPPRIVALSPHTVEILFALELGQHIVGTSEFADYPEQAKTIPRIANHQTINFEQLIALQPTHIIVWKEALSPATLSKLQSLKIPLFISQPNTFNDVASEVRALGKWLGTEKIAKTLSDAYSHTLAELRNTYSERKKITAMYVLWPKPLMVAGGKTWVSQYMEICGATNSFAGAVGSYPQISMEQVLLHDPDIIIESGDIPEASRLQWKQWRTLTSVRHQQVKYIAPDTIERQTLRSASGVKLFCELIDAARQQKYAP